MFWSWIIVVFIRCLVSLLTHSLQRIHWQASNVQLNFFKCVLRKKQIGTTWMRWFFWVNCFVKMHLLSYIIFLMQYFSQVLCFLIHLQVAWELVQLNHQRFNSIPSLPGVPYSLWNERFLCSGSGLEKHNNTWTQPKSGFLLSWNFLA